MIKKAFIYGCLLLVFAHASAQLPDYHVQVLTKTAGLSNPARLEDLMRDQKGFLWLLSASKVQRFDGKNFVSFSFNDRCIAIQEDDQGIIWLMSRQNIYRYKNDYTGFEKLQGYESESVKYRGLLAGPEKKMYILTVDNIMAWNTSTNNFEAFGILPFKTGGSFSFLKSFGNWLFYRKDDNTIVRFNVKTAALDSVKVRDANYLIPINEDSVWVREGIGNSVLVSFTTKSTTSFKQALADRTFNDNRFFVTSGFALSPGKFFTVLDGKGYCIYSSAEKTFKKISLFYNGQPLRSKPILSTKNFYQEKNGTVWFAHEDGLAYFNPMRYSIGLLSNYKYETKGDWNDDVRNFTEDKKGNIWFSTGNGFCKWDKLSGDVINWKADFEATNYLNYSSVKGVGFSAGKLIVSQSEKGIWIFNPEKETFERPKFKSVSIQNKFQKEFNQNIIKLRNGNFLALSEDAWLIEKSTFFVSPLNVSEAGRFARGAYEDEQGRIWLLGRNGILAIDSSFRDVYSLQDKVGGIWYNSIVQIDKETFWAACKNIYEVKLLQQKKLSVKVLFPELVHTHFSGLFKDSLNHIWMSNEEGIYRYLPSKKAYEKFDKADNVQSFNISLSNSYRSSNGTVYFGSMNGINYFIPEKIPLQNDSSQVQLLNVTVNKNDSSFLMSGSLGPLRHDENTIAFDFVSPYLYNGAKIQYRYKLDGLDKEWIETGNNSSVRYNALKPGQYRFLAAASLNGIDWYAMSSAFKFDIRPPFWKTWWFLLLMLLSLAMLALWLVKQRILFIKKREKEKTELQKLRAAGYREQLEIEKIINYFATSMSSINGIDEMLWDVAKSCISKLDFE
ncbi:MAG: hypothetical protein H7X88_12790, partial [Gloeobacteraceae cyanobacterium ES-bin-316]|nr:hypothetical protein [Ferruginibacter sp.]